MSFVIGMATMQSLLKPLPTKLATSYVEMKPVLRNPSEHDEKCRFYLAESAVAPNAGLGVFAGTGLLKGETVGFPDICIFVTDPPDRPSHLHSHSWSGGMFFGQKEGRETRIACEGYGTIFNTMPESHINVRIQSAIQQTHSGATRNTPNAGSITQHYGIHGVALDVIPPGSEFTINYFDWEFKEEDYKGIKRPQRSLKDLDSNGWCIDHMEIRKSTVPGAGRGAFVKRSLPRGTVVVPAPLEVFKDREGFQKSEPEQLFVNYCLQPNNSTMLLYPYGPGVNLINHNSRSPNVAFKWSTNHMHHSELLDMEYDEFWQNVRPGHLILDIVALRDLRAGEELFLDYGPAWEKSWNAHVAKWIPPSDAQNYVYPEDMDDTDVLRTVEEQKQKPYPANLITMCNTPDVDRKENNHLEWSSSEEDNWWWSLAYCHILDRKMGDNGLLEYTVSLLLNRSGKKGKYMPKDLEYDPTIPFQQLYVDTKVPRRAIHWVEKPFHDDEHLPQAFRQPIQFPHNLVSQAWLTGADD